MRNSLGGKFKLEEDSIIKLNTNRAELLTSAFELSYYSRCLAYSEVKNMPMHERNILIDKLASIKEREQEALDSSSKK